MKKVKGSLIITIVKSIKTSPKGWVEYDRILSNQAKEFLKKRILTGSWYPLEDYRECFDSVCFVEARNNQKIILEWSIREANRWLTTLYQAIVLKGDLEMAIEKYQRLHRRFFNFGEIITNFISDNKIELIYIDIPRDWENWYQSAVGWAMAFIKLCIDKEIDYTFLNKSWVNGGWTTIKFSWSP
ncbi:MAG: hypothetical protein ACFFCE_04085 [Promethearchaeota archaeon]